MRFIHAVIASIACCSLIGSPALAQVAAGGLGVRQPENLSPGQCVRLALESASVKDCANVIGQAADYLFEDGCGDFTLQPLGPDRNRWPIVLTIESLHRQTGSTRLTILALVPAGSCSGSYQQIITWPQICDVLKSTVFKAFSAERPLFRSVSASELTSGIQLYLMRSGTGCVSVEKELIG